MANKTFEELFAELQHKAATGDPGPPAPPSSSSRACTPSARRSSRRPPRCGWPPSTRAPTATAEEISQLLYHLQVLMVARGLSLDDVYAHL